MQTEGRGWVGRVLEFRPDGTEIVRHDDATPILGEGPDGDYYEKWTGSATYEVSILDGILTFKTANYDAAKVDWRYGARRETPDFKNEPPPPVEYTCTETTHAQESVDDSYEATFTRVNSE